MRHILPFATIAATAALLSACKTEEPNSPPPPAQLVGGPCSYDETPGIATVSDADAEQVRFLIDGNITPYSRQDLPDYDYATGAQFKVIEKRITKGTCTPYILDILGPATSADLARPPHPASREPRYTHPDTSL